jgi:uncharacterized membrane protein
MSTVKKSKSIKRIYRDDMTIDCDTFKLEVENYARNISFDDKKPLIVGTEHCHFFHTFDSNGKEMSQCNSVGGHTHDVVVDVNENGEMIGTCGPAKSFRVTDDKHVHRVTYIKSDRFKVRTINPKAQEVIAAFQGV